MPRSPRIRLRPRLAAGALAAAALLAAGCGSADPGPPTGAAVPHPEKPTLFDPGSGTFGCLIDAKLPARHVRPDVIQIGPAALDTRIVVAPTIFAAELDQLKGRAEGAEIADRLEFYPGRAPEDLVSAIEGCVNAHSSDGT